MKEFNVEILVSENSGFIGGGDMPTLVALR